MSESCLKVWLELHHLVFKTPVGVGARTALGCNWKTWEYLILADAPNLGCSTPGPDLYPMCLAAELCEKTNGTWHFFFCKDGDGFCMWIFLFWYYSWSCFTGFIFCVPPQERGLQLLRCSVNGSGCSTGTVLDPLHLHCRLIGDRWDLNASLKTVTLPLKKDRQ